MKIEQIEIFSLELPYIKPLVTATTKFVKAEGLVVKVLSDSGLEGYGYVELFDRTGETKASARYAIERVIQPVVLGRELGELGMMRRRFNHIITGNHRAKAGLETACYDLLSKSCGTPLYFQLGGMIRNQVRVARMVGLGDPEVMAEEAKTLINRGLTALKLKIAGDVDLDSKRVAKVRETVGDDIFLKVDANETYDTNSAIKMAKRLANLGVEVFEQPTPRSQVHALLEIKRHSPVKIEADQSVVSAVDAFNLITHRAVDSINTSVQKAGGIVEARRIAELCEVGGIQCVMSNTAGCMLGDAVALHVAASEFSISLPCELGEFECITGDPFAGLEVKDGILKVPNGRGLGVSPRTELKTEV